MRRIIFKPYKKQFQALQLLQDNVTNEVLYGGGARGAKSFLGCAWCLINAYTMPGSAGLIGRNELKRLKATTLITFFEVANHLQIKQGQDFNYNAQDSIITFKNGSIIFLIDLSYMPSDPNYDRLGSYGLTYSFIDEAQEVNIQAINILKGRYSKLKGEGWQTIPKALYTCNPAKNWIYRDFYNPYKNGTIRNDRAFVPSLVTDNPSISQDYIDNLKKADDVTVQRLLYGNFDYDDTPGRLFDYNKINDLLTNPRYNGIKYISCDVARKGKDKAIISVRDGYEEVDRIVYEKCLNVDIENKIKELAYKYNVGMSNTIVDEDGVGGGIVDHLKCKGFINNSSCIQPYSGNNDKKLNFANLKTQCYFELAKLVNNNKIRVLPQDFDRLSEELDVIVQVDIDKDSKIKIISKEEVKEKLGRSPDYSDNCMMRCYFDIIYNQQVDNSSQLIIQDYGLSDFLN